MTKLAVLADIHGVWPALEDLAQFKVAHIIVGGYLFPHCPGYQQRIVATLECDRFPNLEYNRPQHPACEVTKCENRSWLAIGR